MYNNDYLILIDEKGRPYIAHADDYDQSPISFGSDKEKYGGHKYYMRIGAWPNYRYFYSAEEYNRYLENQREQQRMKVNKEYRKELTKDYATTFGDKALKKDMKLAKKEMYKAEKAFTDAELKSGLWSPEYRRTKEEYDQAQQKYEDAKELYNLSRKIDDIPGNVSNYISKHTRSFANYTKENSNEVANAFSDPGAYAVEKIISNIIKRRKKGST